MIFTLIRNEYRKIFRRSKTWVVIGIFAALIVGMACACKLQASDMEYYSSPEAQIENLKNSITEEKGYLEDAKDSNDRESIKMYKDDIKNYKQQIKEIQGILKDKDNPDFWKKLLKEEKKTLKITVDSNSKDEDQKISAQQRIDEINIYLKKDVKPIEEWKFNAINYLIKFIQLIGMIILPCGIAIFMSDIVSGECTPPTFKFLLVQPISRGKVLLSKFIAVTTSAIGLIGGMEIIVYLVLGIFTGFDASKMPALIGCKYDFKIQQDGSKAMSIIANSGHFITRGRYLFESFAFQMLFILACCAFVFLISSIFMSSMVTMAASVISVVVFTMIMMMSTKVASIAHYIFLSYSMTTDVVTGDICRNFNNPNITVNMGIIVLTVTTVLCYAIGYIVFKKKDLLI